MKLEIEYRQLSHVINLLDRLKLKGLKSIHRTRLSRKLQEELERVAGEQLEIQKEYFELDENGNPIIEEDKCKNEKEYLETMNKFLQEKVIIDSGDSQVMLKSVKNAIEECDLELDGREAYTFEYLYTQLEKMDDSSSKENSEED